MLLGMQLCWHMCRGLFMCRRLSLLRCKRASAIWWGEFRQPRKEECDTRMLTAMLVRVDMWKPHRSMADVRSLPNLSYKQRERIRRSNTSIAKSWPVYCWIHGWTLFESGRTYWRRLLFLGRLGKPIFRPDFLNLLFYVSVMIGCCMPFRTA